EKRFAFGELLLDVFQLFSEVCDLFLRLFVSWILLQSLFGLIDIFDQLIAVSLCRFIIFLKVHIDEWNQHVIPKMLFAADVVFIIPVYECLHLGSVFHELPAYIDFVKSQVAQMKTILLRFLDVPLPQAVHIVEQCFRVLASEVQYGMPSDLDDRIETFGKTRMAPSEGLEIIEYIAVSHIFGDFS